MIAAMRRFFERRRRVRLEREQDYIEQLEHSVERFGPGIYDETLAHEREKLARLESKNHR